MLPHAREVDETAVLLLVIGATAVGAVLYLTAERLREWHLHVVVAVGTVMVSLANLAVGMTLLYPLLYSWTALFSFYFFRMRAALVQLAFIGRELRGGARDPGRPAAALAARASAPPR